MNRLVIANWKMNMTLAELTNWLEEFGELQGAGVEGVDVVVAPSHPFLSNPALQENESLYVSSQDVSIYEKGAHTGFVGGFQLKEICDYCIVGHSERGEDKETVLQKRDICLQNELTPIVCFVNVDEAEDYYTERTVLALEDPVNISKDGVYNPMDVSTVETFINNIKEKLPEDAQVVYGGSVNRENADSLGSITQLDGALIGNAGLDARHFYEITSAFGEK
jgi:triosephosphate isomerase (TIM)